MNVPLLNVFGTDTTNSEQFVNFAMETGILSSALEHMVPEQLFNTDPLNPPNAISAVKALSKASAAGQRNYHITQANQATALPSIHHDPATMVEIQNALNVGKEVITHTDNVTVPGWSGAGYIIFDPQTGSGAYKIGGGYNGGVLSGPGSLTFESLLNFIVSPASAAQNMQNAQASLDLGCFAGSILMASPALIFIILLGVGFATKFPGPLGIFALVLTAVFVVVHLISWYAACLRNEP